MEKSKKVADPWHGRKMVERLKISKMREKRAKVTKKSLQREEKKRLPGGVGPPGKEDNGRKVKKLENVGKKSKGYKKVIKTV